MEFANLMPQAIEAEEMVLGAIAIDPSALALVVGKLKPEHFFLTSHRTIYKALISLDRQGMVPNLVTLTQLLTDCQNLDAVGGLNRLVSITEKVISAHCIEDYANLVIDRFLRRQLITATTKMLDLFRDCELETIDTIQQAEALLFEVREQMGNGGSTMAVPLQEIIGEVFQELEQANKGEDASSGTIPTGLKDLDSKTGGLVMAAPNFVAGRPGMGKTQVAIELSLRIATQGKPVLFFSLEMSKKQLMRRIFSRLSADPTGPNGANPSAINVGKFFQRNQFTSKDWEVLSDLLPVAAELPIFIQDKASITLPEIASEARRLKSAFGEIGLIVIDYVQLMRLDKTGITNRTQELDVILSGLREVAKDFDCPLLGIAQLNRGVEQRDNKRPKLSDFRESGGFEQEGALVIGLYRDEYYNKSTDKQGILEMSILKSRFSQSGESVDLLFRPEYGWIANLAKH